MNKIIKSSLIFFLSLITVFGFFSSFGLAADIPDDANGIYVIDTPVSTDKNWCNSTNYDKPGTSKYAPWNIDKATTTLRLIDPVFQCRAISKDKWTESGYVMPEINRNACAGVNQDNCKFNLGCLIRCTRKADCLDPAVGGECKQSSQIDTAYRTTHHQVSLRCGGDEKNTCWVLNPPPPPPVVTPPVVTPPVVIPPPVTYLAPEPKPEPEPKPLPRVSLNNCCSQLVPSGLAYVDGSYGVDHIIQVVINIYNCILCMVAALMLLMFVLGAFTFMTSAGNQSRVDQGKKIITAAVIGGIIVFASVLIVNFAVKTLGGGFTNEARLQVNAGAPAASTASAPSGAGTLATTPTTGIQTSGTQTTNPGTGGTGTKPKMVSFTTAQKQVLEAALLYAKSDNSAVYDQITSAFSLYKSVSSNSTATYASQVDSSGKPLNCPNEVLISNKFFTEASMAKDYAKVSALLHESVHYQQCISGRTGTMGLCAEEQEAYSANADYLKNHDVGQAKYYRCNWNEGGDYKDEHKNPCVPSDPAC